MQVKETTAIVTGANRGLGIELVSELLEAGAAKIYAAARNTNTLSDTIALDPERVIPLQLDITDEAQIKAAVETAADVKLLINNAGVLDFAGALNTSDEIIDRNMNTNFRGTYNITLAFASALENNSGGTIVNLLTFLTYVSAPIFAAYNASKAASWSMAMSLRPYLAPKNISITNVFPTSIDTEMLADLDKNKDTPNAVAKDIIKGIIDGAEDIYPAGAQNTFDAWREDQKSIEAQFAKLM